MVSVIITTYKRNASIVERAVLSIVNQTYTDWELYVIDDSPNTYSERNQVKNKFEELKEDVRIHYVQHKCNRGACVARNTGISLSKGEYIAFLDDDDEWCDTKLEKQVKKMEICGISTGLVYCGCVLKNDNTGDEEIAKSVYKSGRVFSDLTHENFIGGASFPLLRRSCLEDIGNFDELMQSCQDLDVWLRISDKYSVEYVPEPLVIYHIHEGDQITKSINKIIAGRERIIEKNRDYFEQNKKDYWCCIINYAYNCAVSGDRKIALNNLKRAIKIQPFRVATNILYLLRIINITRKCTNEQ